MNRFSAFAVEDEQPAGAQPVKAQAPPKETKKVVVKKPKAEGQNRPQGQDDGEYQTTTDSRQTQRGGRGGRGGDRPRGDAERGGRGGRGRGEGRGGRGRGNGEGRGRGGNRGRGGDRPVTSGAEGDINAEVNQERRTQRERRPRNEEHRNEGKDHDGLPFFERKQAHPDRKDYKKGGHGKGNWGDDKKPVEGAEGAEETKEPRRERREKKPEVVAEPEEEVEEVGFTYADYLNQKSEKNANLTVAQQREHDKLNTKNLQQLKVEDTHITTQESHLTQADLHAKAKTADYDLLGFSAGRDEDEFVERRGGRDRGGRGGRGRGSDRPQGNRPQGGGRKGGKLVVNDNEFPAL